MPKVGEDMSGVQTSIALQDKLTGPLMKMMRAMDNTIKVMENMDSSATSLDTKGLAKARSSIQSAAADMERLKVSAQSAGQNGVKPLQDSFGSLPGSVNKATSSVKGFLTAFAGAAVALVSLRALKQGFDKLSAASDKYVSTKARLSLINDGLQTQAQLQSKIFGAAQRSRSAYGEMADSVAKLNLLAGDAFSGNDEAIRFSELMNKAFALSGAGPSEMAAGMHQLTQAMASGKLQGDEFRSITENAPMLAVAIAKAMGVSKGELKKLSSEGKITADIIKASLFMAADDIEGKFKTMPVTFGQAMTMMKNEGLMAFEPLFVRFNEFVNSDAFTRLSGQVMTFVNIAVVGLMMLFDVIGFIYSAMSAIAEYWPVIAAGLGILIAIYFPLIMSYLNIMLIRLWLMLEPILAQAAAWAIAYWPITLIILAVIALIAVLMYFGVTTEQILGFVGGLFYAMAATIWNIVAVLWNMFAMLAEFLVNVFIDPTYAVQKLMYDMVKFSIDLMGSLAGSFDKAADVLAKVFVTAANIAIGGINGLIAALNSIPGVDIGKVGNVNAGVTSVLSGALKDFSATLKAPTSSKNVVSIPRMDMKSIPGAYKAGQKAGSNLKMPSFAAPKYEGTSLAPTMGGVPANLKDAGKLPKAAKGKNPTGGKLDKIGKIEDKISIADEDLKMLKELADIKSIQNFRTLQPSFTFGDLTIREDADITKIIKGIETYMRNEMDRSTEGAYA